METRAISGQDKRIRLWKEKDKADKCNPITLRPEKQKERNQKVC